jgi:hypothetical protein
MILMAFATSFAVTGAIETTFDVIPVTWVRVDHQSTFGAVALETDVAIGMAGLTGGQILPRFAGMAVGPLMARQHRVRMTALALLIVKEGMLTVKSAVGEAFTMGVKSQVGGIEVIMTLNAKLAFMTSITELRVSARRDRVRDGELGAVHIGHGVTKLTHLVGPTGLVAIETITLFMTGRAIDALGHGSVAVIQRPSRAVRH